MKPLLPAFVIVMLLAHLVTGSWYVKKCANKKGNCRSNCRKGEQPARPARGMCPTGKSCCLLDIQVACAASSKPSGGSQDSSGGAQGATGAPGATGGAPGASGAGTAAPDEGTTAASA